MVMHHFKKRISVGVVLNDMPGSSPATVGSTSHGLSPPTIGSFKAPLVMIHEEIRGWAQAMCSGSMLWTEPHGNFGKTTVKTSNKNRLFPKVLTNMGCCLPVGPPTGAADTGFPVRHTAGDDAITLGSEGCGGIDGRESGKGGEGASIHAPQPVG